MAESESFALAQQPEEDARGPATLIDARCDLFEAQWKRGESPDLAAYLDGSAPAPIRARLFRELLAIDVDYRRRRGESLQVDSYRVRFPEFADAIQASVERSLLESKTAPSEPSESTPSGSTAFLNRLTTCRLFASAEIEAIQSGLLGERAEEMQRLASELMQQDSLTDHQRRSIRVRDWKRIILGNYVLLEPIGEGGMGQVFKARHSRMARIVAIKLLLSEAIDNPVAVARFRREALAAARLNHPNIATAYDADDCDGVHYLVMEFVEGEDLQAIVTRQGPLSASKATSHVLQAARGLAYAHREGIVHRDVKPSNLLLDDKGIVKVLDLGLARFADSQASLTGDGATIGTVDYMAPEQAADARRADARADVYSLGCTLGYLLSAKPVYAGRNAFEKIIAHREAPIPSLRRLRSDVSDALDNAFRRMVAKQPQDRFATMDEVIAALEETSDG